ncbi:GNAT family N-acetyltransferase [Ramlibacter alkalitolerans]|uniref:GNAT family N-acetyltransferase n=1 Tax=Ramlibacter alkalitolerans TaxID=2039631 RepID=A0ABS1JPD7_9BURK|nr:GNAT family N-acetyltransferase [Ramlibacter alkalitolerans]MBL0425731.1 GNAT family N-acetyltransferase [Ramlibacter alkalitolerans]
MDEIEAIERATLAAVPPRAQESWGGWLLAFDEGTVGRCHSAAPLRHEAPAADALAAIAQRYAAHGLATVLRVPELAAFDALRAQLLSAGYLRSKPTLVQTGRVGDLAGSAGHPVDVELAATAAPEWEQVFLGEGFDPVDGASRLAILRRGTDSVFASVRAQGRTVAVGAACLHEGWCGVHGMRTRPAYRGRGLAGAVLSALARRAREGGVQRCFLQVEEGNAPARSLYAGRGFATAWGYAYWKRSL